MVESDEKHVEEIVFAHPEWTSFVLLISGLSFINVIIFAIPMPVDSRYVVSVLNLAFGVVLWADFFYLLRNSPNKRRFMIEQRGWMVLIGNFPIFSIVRILWFRWVLKENGDRLRDFVSLIALSRNASATLLGVAFAGIITFEFAVVSILYFEDPAAGSNIKSVSDAFWWAFVTVATVGYGDRYPITNGGRVVAVLLMAVGIAIFSVATGSLVSWFRSRPIRSRASSDEQSSNLAEIKELLRTHEENYQRLLRSQEESYQHKLDELYARLKGLESNGKDVPSAVQGHVETNERSQ